MAEELIAQYQWRIPLEDWSPLCDNKLQLWLPQGISGTPKSLNSLGICAPPCEMCVTAKVSNTCSPTIERIPAPDELQQDTLKITLCDSIPDGQRYGFLFAGGGIEFAYIASESTGEELAEEIHQAMELFVSENQTSWEWGSVTVGRNGKILSVYYFQNQAGQLNLTVE